MTSDDDAQESTDGEAPGAPDLLAGKRLLVTGVVTADSIAYEIARQAQESGAEVVLTGFGRAKRMTERAANTLPEPPDVLELDVNKPDDLEAIGETLGERWDALDGVVHAIAFAPDDALGGNFLDAPEDSVVTAFKTSAVSLRALAVAVQPLLEAADGASVVGLDFDASVAWPVYDWMGVSKAALESVARYLARDLGPKRTRVNLISAGPIETLAAGGISGFERLAEGWGRQAPLGWDTSDPAPVASTACFLLSDLARAITGEIIHVDGGYHAMGAPAAE
jgi:enoyl-[acyl-carrier protein] reductase I